MICNNPVQPNGGLVNMVVGHFDRRPGSGRGSGRERGSGGGGKTTPLWTGFF